MTTLTFEFNDNRLQKSGCTVPGIMKPIKEYLFAYGVKEVEPNKFETEGINADTIFTSLIVNLTDENHDFINLLDKWVLDSNGEIEDCIEETKNWYHRKGIKNSA